MATIPASLRVVKGPTAQGKTFAFRYGEKKEGKPGSGKIEVGDKPTVIKFDTPEAKRIKLYETVQDLLRRRYLVLHDQQTAATPAVAAAGSLKAIPDDVT